MVLFSRERAAFRYSLHLCVSGGTHHALSSSLS
jgi:hypothetical protein